MTGLDFMFIIFNKKYKENKPDATIEELHEARVQLFELIDTVIPFMKKVTKPS